jgi:ATP-binding cassette, subfamily C, bacterial CydD
MRDAGAEESSAKVPPTNGLAALTRDETGKLKAAGRLFALADLLWIAQAWFIAACVSKFVLPGPADQGLFMWLYPLGFLILAFVRMRLNVQAAKAARKAACTVKSRVRGTLLKAIAKTSPATPLPASGQVAAHVGDQVDALGPYLSHFYPQKIRLSIVPLGILAATAAISWLAALILLVTGPMIPLFMALVGMRAKAASEGQQDELTRMSGFLLDRVRGLETLRLFGAVDRTGEEVRAAGEAFRAGTMKVLRIAFLSSTVLELFSALGIAFVAVYVGFSLLGEFDSGTWGAPLSYTSGLFVLLLAPEYFAPLRAYAAAYHDRAAGLAATDKLSALHSEIADHAETLPERPQAAPGGGVPQDGIAGKKAGVRFESVSLKLGGRQVLSSLSFAVEAGETALLLGPSGAGKTTILDCLLGLHRLDAGRVLVGDTDLSSIDLMEWRQSIAWVGQAPRLFHGSLRANLLRAVPQASEDDLWQALRLAGAVDLVNSMPRGLGTVIGEDGFGLSGGEMRRIALARAALRKDAVLILADEPTAGLDAETARDVAAGLDEMAAGRTMLLATHDPNLMKIGPKIIRLGACPREEVTA